MLFAHMDQLGLIVRKIEATGLIRVERLGGVPEKALPAQSVVFCVDGGDVPGVIANKSHHATAPDEKYRVLPYSELIIDGGFRSVAEVLAAGIDVGTPVVYALRSSSLPADALLEHRLTTGRGCGHHRGREGAPAGVATANRPLRVLRDGGIQSARRLDRSPGPAA